LVNGVDCFDRFHFYDHSAFDHQIDAVSNFEFLAFIDYRQSNFCRDLEISVSKFVCQAGLISAFQEARTEQ